MSARCGCSILRDRGDRRSLVQRWVLGAVLESCQVTAGLIRETALFTRQRGDPRQFSLGEPGEVEQTIGGSAVQPDPQVVLGCRVLEAIDPGDRLELDQVIGDVVGGESGPGRAAEPDDDVDP